MKKVISLVAIVLLLSSLASAQSRKDTEHLLISDFLQADGLAGIHEKVIDTKQDGTQEIMLIQSWAHENPCKWLHRGLSRHS
jgi:hypothetical protein